MQSDSLRVGCYIGYMATRRQTCSKNSSKTVNSEGVTSWMARMSFDRGHWHAVDQDELDTTVEEPQKMSGISAGMPFTLYNR